MAQRASYWHHGVLGVLVLLLLYGVMGVHASGQSVLATTLMLVGGLALWTYSSPRSGALRYLLPGIATALVFVVFPMLYTMGMGFTNYSAQNLLEFERARGLLLDEKLAVADSERHFSLHPHGDQWRIQLLADDSGTALVSPPIDLEVDSNVARNIALLPYTTALAKPLRLRDTVQHLSALRALNLQDPQGAHWTLNNLRSFVQTQALYQTQADGSLQDKLTGTWYRPDPEEGFFTSDTGERLQPGYQVNVGLRHFARIFNDQRFRSPFVSVFAWTVIFSGLTVLCTTALGLLLAVLLTWESLEGRAAYRLVLFLPYAVPGFISILVFKGLFNQNLGEINAILGALFGIKPAWFSDPFLAKVMLLIVNTWLGFPYMMVLCTGLIKAIGVDLYEASAIAGAGAWVNFWKITMPLIVKPLTPLLISAFAFNFNNFVLISLLTGGRPDQLDSSLPAGTTDILVSYTWRIAFQDSGQQFGLASAISTVIFLVVAAITLVQMRLTRSMDGTKP